MKAAFTTGDPDLQDMSREVEKVLDWCMGLPLALSIAGSAVNSYYEDCQDHARFAVQTFCENMEEVHEKMGKKKGEHHPGLSHVVEASLKICEKQGDDMRRRFEALCVLEKQMTMPISALSKLWGVDRKVAGETVETFKQFSLVKRVQYIPQRNVTKAKEEFGLRLHDLVLERCQNISKDKQMWHQRLVDSYVPVATGCRLWWEVDDDGYILSNLSRHLAKGGCVSELRDMLCDIRWVMLREHTGGWAALDMDFKSLLLVSTDDTDDGMKHMHDVLECNWAHLSFGRSQFAFQVCGNVSRAEREKPFTASLLGSMVQFWETPWLRPVTKCVWRKDVRERAAWPMSSKIIDMDISWSSRKLVIALARKVIVWSMEMQAEEQSLDLCAICAAISADGKRIVSAADDGTVRLWDAERSSCIEATDSSAEISADRYLRTGIRMRCIAVDVDNNRFVFGTHDGRVVSCFIEAELS